MNHLFGKCAGARMILIEVERDFMDAIRAARFLALSS
jgi:hypothetical protein